LDQAEREAALKAGIELFDGGRYLAAHELFEELWEDTQGPESDFYKGLLQAAVALHHFEQGNLDGAAKLHGGSRRCLAAYLPTHAGLDLGRFLGEMQAWLRAVQKRQPGTVIRFDPGSRPRLEPERADQA